MKKSSHKKHNSILTFGQTRICEVISHLNVNIHFRCADIFSYSPKYLGQTLNRRTCKYAKEKSKEVKLIDNFALRACVILNGLIPLELRFIAHVYLCIDV